MAVFDPFVDMARFKSQLDRAFENAAPQERAIEGGRALRPAVDVFEDPDSFQVFLDLPGADRETLDVQLTGEDLVIRGERKWTAPEKGAFIHAERPHGQFHRTFRLGIPVQGDQVEASYRDGVLTVRLPKAETLKPRKVAVRTEPEG